MEQTENKDVFRMVLEGRARNLREELEEAEAPLTAFLCRGESVTPEVLLEAVHRREDVGERIREFERLTGVRV